MKNFDSKQQKFVDASLTKLDKIKPLIGRSRTSQQKQITTILKQLAGLGTVINPIGSFQALKLMTDPLVERKKLELDMDFNRSLLVNASEINMFNSISKIQADVAIVRAAKMGLSTGLADNKFLNHKDILRSILVNPTGLFLGWDGDLSKDMSSNPILSNIDKVIKVKFNSMSQTERANYDIFKWKITLDGDGNNRNKTGLSDLTVIFWKFTFAVHVSMNAMFRAHAVGLSLTVAAVKFPSLSTNVFNSKGQNFNRAKFRQTFDLALSNLRELFGFVSEYLGYVDAANGIYFNDPNITSPIFDAVFTYKVSEADLGKSDSDKDEDSLVSVFSKGVIKYDNQYDDPWILFVYSTDGSNGFQTTEHYNWSNDKPNSNKSLNVPSYFYELVYNQSSYRIDLFLDGVLVGDNPPSNTMEEPVFHLTVAATVINSLYEQSDAFVVAYKSLPLNMNIASLLTISGNDFMTVPEAVISYDTLLGIIKTIQANQQHRSEKLTYLKLDDDFNTTQADNQGVMTLRVPIRHGNFVQQYQITSALAMFADYDGSISRQYEIKPVSVSIFNDDGDIVTYPLEWDANRGYYRVNITGVTSSSDLNAKDWWITLQNTFDHIVIYWSLSNNHFSLDFRNTSIVYETEVKIPKVYLDVYNQNIDNVGFMMLENPSGLIEAKYDAVKAVSRKRKSKNDAEKADKEFNFDEIGKEKDENRK